MKRAFQVNQKTFFLVQQVLAFRFKKQTSQNVADTAFNVKKVKQKPLEVLLPGKFFGILHLSRLQKQHASSNFVYHQHF